MTNFSMAIWSRITMGSKTRPFCRAKPKTRPMPTGASARTHGAHGAAAGAAGPGADEDSLLTRRCVAMFGWRFCAARRYVRNVESDAIRQKVLRKKRAV